MIRTTAFASILLAVGCQARDDEPTAEPAIEAVETVDTTSNEGALIAATLPADGAAVAAEEVPTFWSPAGCATATRTGDTVVVQLAGCTGPWGLLDVTGSISVTYHAVGDA